MNICGAKFGRASGYVAHVGHMTSQLKYHMCNVFLRKPALLTTNN